MASKRDAQLAALRERTPAERQLMEAQRYFATAPPLPASLRTPLSDPFAVTEEAALEALLAELPEAKARQFEAGAARTGLGLLDPISTAAGIAGGAAGLTDKQREALEMAVGTVSPGPGEYTAALKTAPLMLGNVFMMPPSRIQKQVGEELTEKWFKIGEHAAREGRPELLTRAIESLTQLGGRAKDVETLRKAAAQWLTEARRTVMKKGTRMGEALRSQLYKRGPGEGTLSLHPGAESQILLDPTGGGTIEIGGTDIFDPFALAETLRHETGHAAEKAIQVTDPELHTILQSQVGQWRPPESEMALSLLSPNPRVGGGRQRALEATRSSPEWARSRVGPRPHGATPEMKASEELADLIAQLTSATGQSTLSDAQIRALRGKLGGIVPGLR